MSFKKRFYFIATLLLSVTLLVFSTSCKKNGKGNENSNSQNNNVSQNSENKLSGKTIKVLAADYMIPSEDLRNEFREETGIVVEYEKVNWEQIPDALEINKMEADIVEVDWTRLGLFKRNEFLEPISKDEFDIEDMPSVKAFTFADEIYAIPYFNDFTSIFYNTEQYSSADIGELPKTWDEVHEDSVKISGKNISRYPFSTSLSDTSDTTMEFISLAYSRNGRLFNDNGTLNIESADDTLGFIDTLVKETLISPSSINYYVLDDYRKIASGETSCTIGPASYIIGLNDTENSNVVGKIKLSKLPGKDGIFESTLSSSVGFGIMKSSKEKEAAKKYIEWFTSKEVQEKIFKESNIIPSRISVLEKMTSSNEIENSGDMLEIAKNVEFPIPDGVKLFYKEIDPIISYCINRMAIGEMNKDEALSLMDRAITQVLNGQGTPAEINRTLE